MTDTRLLFNPASIALVGATEKSRWSVATLRNLRAEGFAGPVYMVNRRGGVVHGEPAYPSLSALPEPVDLAYVMVPTGVVPSVLREGADAGVRGYVVLTGGFAESGAEGTELEAEIAELAAERGLTVLGPNGIGYINASAGITPFGLPIAPPLLRGSVGIVLQSGALANAVLTYAHSRDIGISLLTSTGNETTTDLADIVDHLVDDPGTRAIALFVESVRSPARFAAAARRALLAGKPVVALKIGRSAAASQVAQAHTGALVGQDRVVDAAFRRLGVVRVRSIEDLVTTAGLLAETGPLPGPRVGVVTPSGGACEIIADRAQDEGLELPAYAPDTVRRLLDVVPPDATVQNPLDVTGYVAVDRTLLHRAMEAVGGDPGIDCLLVLWTRPPEPCADVDAVVREYAAAAARVAGVPVPVVVVDNVLTDVTPFGRDVRAASGYPRMVVGIEHGMTALGAAVRWSAAYRSAGGGGRGETDERDGAAARQAPDPHVAELAVSDGGAPDLAVPDGVTGTWGEHRAGRLLREAGVPVVPSVHALTVSEAVEAAEEFGYPVVVKTASEGFAHKTESGGVRLGLDCAGAVRAAFRAVTRARGMGRSQAGVLVQPQRSPGFELLVGVTRDPSWGLTLTVGLGGIWAEALADTAVRLLPVDAAEIREALRSLRAAALFEGARGAGAVDLALLSEVIKRVCDVAASLGDRLEALEINPLAVGSAGRFEALDALVIWRTPEPTTDRAGLSDEATPVP